jgi:hypothetical protein
VEQLERVTNRRNKIAHESDRRGDGRASITVGETETILGDLRSIAEAIETLLT